MPYPLAYGREHEAPCPPIELGTIARELGPVVENLAKDLLNLRYMPSDGQHSAKLFLQVRRGRKMVGMCMGLNQPCHRQSVRLYEFNDFVGRAIGSPARCWFIVQNRIYDRGFAALRVKDDISDRVGVLVEEPLNNRAKRFIAKRPGDLLAG